MIPKKSIVRVCHKRRSDLHFKKKLETRSVLSRTPSRKQQASTLGAETKVRAKEQHQLVVLREAVRQAKARAETAIAVTEGAGSKAQRRCRICISIGKSVACVA